MRVLPKLAQKVLDGSTSCDANSTVVDRPLPDCQPTPFSPHRPRCRNLPRTVPTTLQRRLQRPHLAARYTLGRMFLRGSHCTATFNSIRPPLFRGRPLMRFTPALAALRLPRSGSDLRPQPSRPNGPKFRQRRHQSSLAMCGMRRAITARTVMLPLVYVDACRPRLTELRRGGSQWEDPNRSRA